MRHTSLAKLSLILSRFLAAAEGEDILAPCSIRHFGLEAVIRCASYAQQYLLHMKILNPLTRAKPISLPDKLDQQPACTLPWLVA